MGLKFAGIVLLAATVALGTPALGQSLPRERAKQ
jgi:hypothetical protein